MITRLVEIYENKLNSFSQSDATVDDKYSLREVFVNVEHVVLLRPNYQFVNANKNKLPEGLHSSQEYTTLYINRGHSGMEITVIGDLDTVEKKLKSSNKKVLKG
tara:strand:+ start:190 stop:501 length:312 start_codon:yes stop_codon:yes gene_type:complete